MKHSEAGHGAAHESREGAAVEMIETKTGVDPVDPMDKKKMSPAQRRKLKKKALAALAAKRKKHKGRKLFKKGSKKPSKVPPWMK